MTGYTVIDVETTGLVPERGDRVVEIGIVKVSDFGEIQEHWSTLVNPQRDVGPTRIHGITASDVRDAPTFAEIAPYVLGALGGRTVVAHNAVFDLRFLASELVHAGVALTDLPLLGLCTMQWSSTYLSAPSRRLIDCCTACGVELHDAHSAHADALAAAGLLAHYLDVSRFEPPWGDTVTATRKYAWPPYGDSYPELRMVHRDAARAAQRDDAWLERIVSRMPRSADYRVESYLDVLEMALLDRFLAEHEKDQLVAVATAAGLTRGMVLDVHGSYLEAMARAALDDGVVTTEERRELDHVAAMLGLRPGDVDAALRVATVAIERETPATDGAIATAGIVLERGDRVVFTGEMRRERSEWEILVRSHGLEPGGVTKKTKVVVASDPNSLSGKAVKARSYGVPIVTEASFERMFTAWTRGTA
ncbi:exonuclease domain-containing protein [Arsenicicoccus bolidensis]|uniref:DNA polymerase III subunit epsilon n=1 Tax=Arsenicicoccus bolidensis TaxID=229480 RepID=A0ABS9PY74_9MICO|nr:exonuclease domain-containing protein [Arsenicicoccus bolidensis]MCG7320454.1 DNA polymerase III subunit epsilon [Arsenicicoccus bolidensis]